VKSDQIHNDSRVLVRCGEGKVTDFIVQSTKGIPEIR
jgi:hypothetical protein